MSIVYVSRITVTGATDQISDFARNSQSLITRYLCAPRTRAAQDEDAVVFVSFDKDSKTITVDAPHLKGNSLSPQERFLSDPVLVQDVLGYIEDTVQSETTYSFQVATRNWDFSTVTDYFSKQYPQLLFQHWIWADCDDGYDVYVLQNGTVLDYIHYNEDPYVRSDDPQVEIKWRYHVPRTEKHLDI